MIFSSPSSFWVEVIHENYCSVYLYKFTKPLFHTAINLHQGSLAQATSSMAGNIQHNAVNPAQKGSWELCYKLTTEYGIKLGLHSNKNGHIHAVLCTDFFLNSQVITLAYVYLSDTSVITAPRCCAPEF